jgi:hypothetical protein
MWTRREIVAGGALGLLFFDAQTCSCVAASRALHSAGCRLADVDFDTIYPAGTRTQRYISGEEPIIYKSGDTNFDFALAHTLAKLAEQFGVLPGFAFYDDSDAANGYATPRARMNKSDGTVLIGLNLLRSLREFVEAPEVYRLRVRESQPFRSLRR